MSVVAPDYGRAFGVLRETAGPHWQAYVHHPFVEGLKDGTLPRAAFLNYLVQDYIFLMHFSRAWALGVVKAETLDEMKACAGTVDALVNHEMQLHVGICAQAGITENDLAQATEATANMAYTRYVIDAGVSGDFTDLLAALAPCVLGYGEIGARLGALSLPDGPYADWIATYAGDEYQALCHNVGALLDAALVRRLGPAFEDSPRWQTLGGRFMAATRLEVGFWDMGFAAR
ncbi:MAG: thiaminase/transcriptional activator TenA [Paracoccaceae bacterium]|jgi:thiaminase/transcriptional activator TenA